MPDENLTNDASENESSDWRKPDSPSDLLYARDSQYSYETFDGRAVIYESADSPLPLEIDLFIRNVDIRLEEHIQVSTRVGETFGIVCFGKALLKVVFSAILADSQLNYGKMYLVDAYKNKLRLGAVARRGKIPVVIFGSHALQGPFLSMQISESSASEDTITVVFTMLLTALQVVGDGEPLLFDYAHGVEADNPGDFIGNPFALTAESVSRPESSGESEKPWLNQNQTQDPGFMGQPKPFAAP